MMVTIPRYLKMLHEHNTPVFDEKYFEKRHNAAIGADVKTVRPVLEFPDGNVRLGYNVGSRPNGTDVPRWPANLLTEVVS